MLNRLPDIVRLQLTGNITYSPAADGKPAKVLLNFGQIRSSARSLWR
jgi:hypothetical protein